MVITDSGSSNYGEYHDKQEAGNFSYRQMYLHGKVVPEVCGVVTCGICASRLS